MSDSLPHTYVLSYFRTEAEALHLAVSDDGLVWEALKGNRPVLTGTVGTKTLRDPFLCHDEATGLFHLLATNGWNSDSIVHASSPDLIAWSEQTLIPVMRDITGTRNTWAPEAFYDREASVWRLIWSSSIGGREVPYDHRIWGTTTTDFVHYTPSTVFFDPGYNVIDATVRYQPGSGMYLMVFKDERGENRPETENKAMRLCTAPTATGPWSTPSTPLTPSLTEGPTLFTAPDGALLMLYDHFMDGHFGIRRSANNGVTWESLPDEGQALLHLPPGPRHASVLEVDSAVVTRLRVALS